MLSIAGIPRGFSASAHTLLTGACRAPVPHPGAHAAGPQASWENKQWSAVGLGHPKRQPRPTPGEVSLGASLSHFHPAHLLCQMEATGN